MPDKKEPLSCPDPEQITDCQNCVQKGLATCGWANEQEYKKEDKKEVDIALLL